MQTYLNLELPEDSPVHAPKFQFQESTMQVPIGDFSMLDELALGNEKAANAMVFLALNHASSWDSGKTWKMPIRTLAKQLGISKRYINDIIIRLKQRWMLSVSSPTGNQYLLRHHDCDPEDVPLDPNGKPLKLAMPRGENGIFERIYTKRISWKAGLVWIVYRDNSDWETAITYPCTMLNMAKRCRFAPNTITKLIQELLDAEMMERLSKPSEKSVFQLYPRPHPKESSPRERPKREIKVFDDGVKLVDGYYISSKGKYRCHRETEKWGYRNNSGKWVKLLDKDRQHIPEAVIAEFSRYLHANCDIEQAISDMEKSREKRGVHYP